uniref:Uncharacterized protein n=1 Tax=Arundo donax TaxID=35708 RepID=A0A0A9AC00_ARUDO
MSRSILLLSASLFSCFTLYKIYSFSKHRHSLPCLCFLSM